MSKKTTPEKNAAAAAPVEEPASPTAGDGSQSPAPAAAAAEPGPDYKAMYDQANDRWLRARAEFDNYRKRVQREVAETRTQTVLQTVHEFLGIHDQLGLALVHAQASTEAQAIRQGLEMIHTEFGRVLASLGVTRIEAAGKPFDPGIHEAVSQEPSAEVPAGTVVRELKAGFVLGDRLVRPASVAVSSGPARTSGAGAGRDGETGAGKQ